MRRSHIPRLCASLVLFSAACGGESAAVTAARLQLRLGELDAAESELASEEGRAASALRAAIAERRIERAAIEARLTELASLDPDDALAQLARLRAAAPDLRAREMIEVAQSRTYDRSAAAGASRGHAQVHPLGYRLDELEQNEIVGEPLRVVRRAEHVEHEDTAPLEAGTVVRASALDARLLDEIRQDVRASIESRDWARGLAVVEMALAGAGERTPELSTLRAELRERARVDMERVLHANVSIEEERGLEAARAALARELGRFPSSAELLDLPRAIEELDGRIALQRRAGAGSPRERTAASRAPRAPARDEVDALAAEATALEDAGDLAAAAERWIEAAFALPPGSEREACLARARGTERRALLRAELAAACAADPEGFAALGIAAAGPIVVGYAGEARRWEALPLEVLKQAARRARLSQEAELALLDLRLRSGDAAGAGGALADIAARVERGEMDEVEAWLLVARHLGVALPEDGFVFVDGRWLDRAEVENAALAARISALEQELGEARADRRAQVLATLIDLGGTAAPAAERALHVRWEKALRAVRKGRALQDLERLARARRELDGRRETALELIFDEDEYFYPYAGPGVPHEKQKLYPAVQRRVDELVAALREAWDGGRPVRLPRGFREGLDELAWDRERAAELGRELALPVELPDWLLAVETGLERLTLADFAWSAAEREGLARDRAVRARNERLWATAAALEPEQRPGDGERVQVAITNDYRALFGRRALAWNARIQAAARMHSDYMANTGDFGHFEPDPERRSPGDRMRLCGYTFGVSENCHMGSGDPGGAHAGWIRSSGHHRNILMPGQREMASALTSRYWTQDFGTDRTFEQDL